MTGPVRCPWVAVVAWALLLGQAAGVPALAANAPGVPQAAASAPAPARPASGSSFARPRIGLVLAGGGARGGAHLGVLKVLEELHVPVDVIVGTSAGSIVAAAYASGMPLAQIETEMSGLRTEMLFRDIDRKDTPLRLKAADAINYIGPQAGLNGTTIELPLGVVAGISIEAVLRKLTARQRVENFDKLPIPFRAIATDLVTSDMVVIDHGNLAVAVRASMAIPAALSPVELEGRLLVDGGLSRNLPVDVARSLGADVIIAVDVGTPLRTRAEITSLLSVTDQISRMLTNDNVSKSLSELGPRDLLIAPDLGAVTTLDFDRLLEAAAAGEKAARSASAQLAGYSIGTSDYLAWHTALVQDLPSRPERIEAVRVAGNQRVNAEVIAAAMQTKAGDAYDPRVADSDLRRIFARGDFEHVRYNLATDAAGGPVFVADVAEKSWGPNYVRVGLGLSTDLSGDSYFSLVASHRATWLNSLGGEWRNNAQTGQTALLATEFYQPLTPEQLLFVAPHAQIVRQPFDVFDAAGVRLLSYRRASYDYGIDVGAPLGNWGEVRLGASRGAVEFLTDTGIIPGDLLVPKTDMAGVTARLRVDTLDNLRFPRSGYQADIQVYSSLTSFGAVDAYTKGAANFTAAFAEGPHSVQLGLRGAGALDGGKLPLYELVSLGGFLQLSGYKTGELLGREMAFGRLIYNYRVSAPGLLDGAYAGVSLEAGRVGDGLIDSARSGLRTAGSLYFAVDSPLGPFYAAYGRAGGNHQAVYLFLGRP